MGLAESRSPKVAYSSRTTTTTGSISSRRPAPTWANSAPKVAGPVNSKNPTRWRRTRVPNLYVSDTANSRLEQFSPSGRFLTEWKTWGPSHQVYNPTGLSVATNGKLYISDAYGDKVTTWTPPKAGAAHLTYASTFGSSGSGNGQFSTPINTAIDGEGNIWVTDYGNNRFEKFSAKGTFIATYGKEGSGNGQFQRTGRHRHKPEHRQCLRRRHLRRRTHSRCLLLRNLHHGVGTTGTGKLTKPGSIKIDSAGNVWVPDMTADRIVEFSSTGTYIAAYGKEGAGEVQFKQPTGVAFSGENVYVADSANHRIQELSNKGAFIRQFGKEGEGSGEAYDPEGISADAAGNIYVVDDVASHVEEFTPAGVISRPSQPKVPAKGDSKAPVGDAIDAAGNMYVVDTENNRVEKWATGAVHDEKTVYYSVAPTPNTPACGNHPEWANMPCETLPAAQPNTSGISNLPVSLATYSMWTVPETITETFGSTTRVKKETFDAAGRALTSEVTSAADTALPKVTNEYNSTTGALEAQSTTSEGHTKTITTVRNRLGQVEKYTDADGVTSTYKYDAFARLQEVNYGTVDGESASQIYSYDATSGVLASLYDSSAGTFTAKYDVEGNITSEGYPNGMTTSYARNQLGDPTGIEYTKTTHCSSNCVWFSNTITPSIHGEPLNQTSTLGEEPSYGYDAAGRLTQVQEIPSGKGCSTRIYAYDEEGDRTSQTNRGPGPSENARAKEARVKVTSTTRRGAWPTQA